ncbi:hypothetical protein C8Q70DRAFT_1055812 [Cubamyces menziesii]|nr:hypothetical protein C8Q70DRAFT_1055812 [Cubamyces menziesii]
MFLQMPPTYQDDQDYYPPLSSSRSPSPGEPSPQRSPPPSLFGSRRDSHHYPYRSAHAPPAPPTSIPLDDNFDAATTEVPTEWALHSRTRQGDGHPEYDESVTGYQNYVVEMERMLEGQMESAARAQERTREAFNDVGRERERGHERIPEKKDRDRSRRMSTSPATLRRIETSIVEESVRSSSRAGHGGRRSLGSHARAPLSPPLPTPPPPPENARQVSGKKGRLELVEQRVLEDSATRTISLWRERVAASSAGGDSNVDSREREQPNGDGRSEVGSHMHRRMPSGSSVNGDPRLRRVVSDHPRYASSVQGGLSRQDSVKGADKGKAGRASYERSEYLVSYHNTKSGIPKELFSPRSEMGGSGVPARELRTPSSPTTNKTYFEKAPSSPSLRRHAARRSLDRSEPPYFMAYPQTPPLTGSQASSGSPTGKHALPTHAHSPPLRSPLQGSFRDIREALSPAAPAPASSSDPSAAKATRTSSVEAILASCDPSLLHIAPVLQELGIKRVDHLRAVARLSEDTRDREVKEQALRRGVSVVEWAIFLDKLQTL